MHITAGVRVQSGWKESILLDLNTRILLSIKIFTMAHIELIIFVVTALLTTHVLTIPIFDHDAVPIGWSARPAAVPRPSKRRRGTNITK